MNRTWRFWGKGRHASPALRISTLHGGGGGLFQKLAAVRTLRSVGGPPVFRKSYHSGSRHPMRSLLIAALHAIGKSGLTGQNAVRNLKVPDFVELSAPRVQMVVVKSINFVDRAGLFARTVPGLRLVLVVRDPRSVVASRLRGLRAGKFVADELWEGLVNLEPAKRRGLTVEQFRRLPRAVQMAWDWLAVNETAMEDIANSGNARIVCYRAVVDAPEPTMRGLFDFAGLPWAAQTARFIAASRSGNSRGRYYGVSARGISRSAPIDGTTC